MPGENELIVFVYDPSELGAQPFGKQRAASIAAPGTDGEKYTPTSGIWQTVWLEEISEHYISELSIETNLTAITVATSIASAAAAASSAGFSIKVTVESAPGTTVAVGTADASGDGTAVAALSIPAPQLWSPESPFLYNLTVTLLNAVAPATSAGGVDSRAAVDKVLSYDRPLSRLQRQGVYLTCTT